MKAAKLILAISVVALIGFFIWKWWPKPPCKGCPTGVTQTNLYTKRIQKDIDSLQNMPEKTFCHAYYQQIQDRLDYFWKQGSLGLTTYKDGNIEKTKKDANANSQWKDYLSQNLYSAYAPVFVEQAMYIFSRSEWKIEDINFIRNEVKSLKASSYLQASSPVAFSFNKINFILARYDDRIWFINDCKKFPAPNDDLNSSYPDMSIMIAKSKGYMNTDPNNDEINHCTRLKNDLENIPEMLFEKHIDYLKKKINANGEEYCDCTCPADWSKKIFNPLKAQINALDNKIYGIDFQTFMNGYDSVNNLLMQYNRKAYLHNYKPIIPCP